MHSDGVGTGEYHLCATKTWKSYMSRQFRQKIDLTRSIGLGCGAMNLSIRLREVAIYAQSS